MNRETFIELRNLLAELYPDLSSIQRILHDAGIDQVRIELNTKVIDTWHFILREAEKLDQTARLLEVVKQEYGTNKKFQYIYSTYLRETDAAALKHQNDQSTKQSEIEKRVGHFWQRPVMVLSSLALMILLIVLWSQREWPEGSWTFNDNASPTPTATVSPMPEDQSTVVAVVSSTVTPTATITPDMTATEEANIAVEAKAATQTAAIPTMTRTSTNTPSPTTTLVPTVTATATASNTSTPTFTPIPTPMPSNLLSYFTQEGDKKSLHILQSDGTSKTLVDGVVGIKVLDISPDGRYLALAVSATQEIVSNKVHTRFLNGSEVDLQVLSVNGLESNVVLSGILAFDARFGENGELFVATLDADTGVYRTVNYAVADTNGSNLHTFHSSENYFPPTLTPTYTPTPDSLTTYFTGDENSKSLHILNYDGTSTTLVENVSDIKILDMSPDRRYLALAISYEGVITGDGKLSRFVISPDLSLAVASMDTHEVKVILEVGSGIDARYSATDTLFIAHLNKISDTSAHISYLIAKADGSELREFYVSQNEFPNTPTPIPTDEG